MAHLHKVTLTWKVTGAVKTAHRLSSTLTFEVLPNPGFYSAFGVIRDMAVSAKPLSPAPPTFRFSEISSRRLGIDVGQKKLPFTVPVQMLGLPLSFNLKVRHYPPSLIVLTIQLSTCELRLTDTSGSSPPRTSTRTSGRSAMLQGGRLGWPRRKTTGISSRRNPSSAGLSFMCTTFAHRANSQPISPTTGPNTWACSSEARPRFWRRNWWIGSWTRTKSTIKNRSPASC